MSFKPDTKDNDEPLQGIKGNSSLSRLTGQTAEDCTDTSVSKLTIDMQLPKSTTVSISSESRSKTGGKVTMEVSVKCKAGGSLVTEGEVEAKASIDTSGEVQSVRKVAVDEPSLP